MEYKKLLSYTRQAVDTYNMISPNDKIAIGISGGKDSLTLLYALSGLLKFYPNNFELVAININLGIGIQNFDEIKNICDKLSVKLFIVNTEISDIVFNKRKESNPCSLCAKMRKGALNTKALELGCNKIAYAHHKDDIVETMLLSLFYEGRFNTIEPVTHLEETNLDVIRPLLFVSESEIIGFKNKMNIPIMKNLCPADGYTKRQYIKELLLDLNKQNHGINKRIFSAIKNSTLEGWVNKNGNKEELSRSTEC